MRIMTILGTRPEIIRLSQVIPRLDAHTEHVLVHTGQNFDERLSALFFNELGLREPDVYLGIRGKGFGEQVGLMLAASEELFNRHLPDRLLILGDTNSGLTAMVARRFGIPVYHMEAGNRCYDDRVPEEVNRRVIDHASSVLLPYTQRSRENLLREGIPGERIFVTGNPIKEVIDAYAGQISASTALEELHVEPGEYFLVTMHRAENVDHPQRLRALVDALECLHMEFGYPVICSFHPRTRAKVFEYSVDVNRAGIRFVDPLGFFDFIKLEQSAFCVLSDSGTVQEEACIFGVPNVTIRDVTERPETVECGSNVLAGVDIARIGMLVRYVTEHRRQWQPPWEYLAEGVADTVCRLLLSYRIPDLAESTWIKKVLV